MPIHLPDGLKMLAHTAVFPVTFNVHSTKLLNEDKHLSNYFERHNSQFLVKIAIGS